MHRIIISCLLCISFLSLFSGCASCNPEEIDWDTTSYQPAVCGGYLPEKWAKSAKGAQNEMAIGGVLCYFILPTPIGLPLLLNGWYRVSKYTDEAKKFDYEIEYRKQIKKQNEEREALLKEALGE